MDLDAVQDRCVRAFGAGLVAIVVGVLLLANATGDPWVGEPETSMPMLIGGWLLTGLGGMLVQGAVVGWIMTATKQKTPAVTRR